MGKLDIMRQQQIIKTYEIIDEIEELKTQRKWSIKSIRWKLNTFRRRKQIVRKSR